MSDSWRKIPGIEAIVAIVLLLVAGLAGAYFDHQFSQWIEKDGRLFVQLFLPLFAILILLTSFGLWFFGEVAVVKGRERGYRDTTDDVHRSLDGTVTNLGSRATEFGNLVQDFKTEHGQVREWIGNIGVVVNTLDESVLVLRKAIAPGLWLSRPWDYINFIEEADANSRNETNRPIGSITLYGTMVGFAFLLPVALRNHACRSKGEFTTLQLIASDATVKTGRGEERRDLIYYPLYLVATLVLELLENCRSFEESIERRGSGFNIDIVYLPHDLISAAIMVGEEAVSTLQALDSGTFTAILKGTELQPGFRYHNRNTQEEVFKRHKDALGSL